MFEKIKARFYESLIKSIKDRKESLGLVQTDILRDPKRVSKILNLRRDESHPYLIGPSEYPRLNCLFLCEDHDSFTAKNDLEINSKKLIEKCGNNYDKMLWGHIDWDRMFQDVITELSEMDISEKLEKHFEDTLVDYAPYAVIRYDELPFEYARIPISPDVRKKKRQNAIKRVHLRHGSGLFKQTFYEKFSGKTLQEFHKEFHEFVSVYLHKREPNKFSIGLQAYNFHINLSKFAVYWQKLPEVQYVDMSEKKSDFQTLLEEYIQNGREQMKMLEEYQQKFDEFDINLD